MKTCSLVPRVGLVLVVAPRNGIRSYVRSELLACDLQCGICGICCSCQIGRVCSNHYDVHLTSDLHREIANKLSRPVLDRSRIIFKRVTTGQKCAGRGLRSGCPNPSRYMYKLLWIGPWNK
ncbi:PREDICTED: uncharacterized protein LOC106309269 [Brassica oleracea var. oleracea]|uniref:uncharacterized protein LOC106309269 n=1 Tax=Brassica oleracea var. oleracea TaxID=109376 RepID=UPI0006A74A58|nr:PREDICTED: uncharacterized protein LOC106309269 [Brassica oleracea var. oleracea]